MNPNHHNQNTYLRLFIIMILASTLVLRCMPAASHLSKGKGQESVALGRSPVQKVASTQEQQLLDKLDALIKTMSIEELVEITMLDVEDSSDRTTTLKDKTAHIRHKLNTIGLKKARCHASEALIKKCLVVWKDRDVTFVLCKYLNAGEKLKTVTNDKVRRYIDLYRAVLKEYMS